MLTRLTISVFLFMLAGPLFVGAQNQNDITGTVIDANSGESLPGVSVFEKDNPGNGTTTDNRGEFKLRITEGSTLVFSYLGYLTQEVKAGDRRVFHVELAEDPANLDEVVVVGYGEQKKIHLTGAIDAIDASEIEDLPLGNLGAALRGRMLGLSVSGGTSRPGHAAELTIRNPLSLAKDGGNNMPLFVIDGVLQIDAQGNNDPTFFNNLDPSEVESISILKDASAAVYGSRAANGVVIVTTKRGQTGAPRISYSGSIAVNDEAYRTKMMSAYDLARYVNIMNGPYGANESSDDQERFFSQDELEHFRNIDHDWLDQAWSSAYNTRHSLNASGGGEQATYFAGVSWYKQNGNLGKLDHQKWTFRAGADVDVVSGVKAGLQVSGFQQNIYRVNSEVGGENEENDYRNLLKAPRYVPPYIDGLPVHLPGGGGNDESSYHFFELNDLDNYRDLKDFNGSVNLYAEYSPSFIPGFKVRGSYARSIASGRTQIIGTQYLLYRFDLQGQNGHIYEGATNPEAVTEENDNRLRLGNTQGIRSQANFSVNYDRQFGDHTLGVFATIERSESESHFEEILKDEPSPFTNGTLRTAFGELGARDFSYEGGSLGYVGQVNYRYGNKYIADLMFRSDASTKFAPENYWGKFWSLGLGWVLSEEEFFDVSGIDFLKLRYSVGLLGKDDTQPWGWRQRYTFQDGQGAVFGEDDTPAAVGFKMERSPNRDATWSDDFKQNLGIDARFLDSRLSLTLEGFYNKGTNMLLERTATVPVTVGGTVASQNYGEVNFFGYEISLGWNDNAGDFNYGVSTRFSWSDNKVKKGNFNEADLFYPWNPRPGESSDNGQWGFDYLGMFQNQEEIDAYVSQYNITGVAPCEDCDPVLAEDLQPGMLYYRDVRGQLQEDGTFGPPDGVIDNNDQIRLSKKASNHYGFGVTLRAGYKGLRFEAVLSGSFGGWSDMDARSQLEGEIPDLYENGPTYWADIYDPELNPGGKYPNPYWEDVSLGPVSSFWRVNSFRMRVRNFTLSYTLPREVLNRLSVSNARVILSGVNPLNLYNPFDYRDAEGSWENYPVLRTYSLGVNVTF